MSFLRKKNKKIAIPGDQAVMIEKYINMYEGYRSVPEFVREAVRKHLDEKKGKDQSVKQT